MNDPRLLPNGMFEIESESTEATYVMEQGRSCSCPHWTKKLAGTGVFCKHLRHLEAFIAPPAPTVAQKLHKAVVTAVRVPDAILPSLLSKYGDEPVIQTALIYERARRGGVAAGN